MKAQCIEQSNAPRGKTAPATSWYETAVLPGTNVLHNACAASIAFVWSCYPTST